ncbi:MAG: hypothetical protein A2168_04860 [Planctomycetes bacterium RBG_13_50_24]|nr:MAG: hypothetical protein A2168_04860 [Planctomycetes bacterium RBG_13_50_24]
MTNNKYLRLSAVNENDYYLYSGSPREICKTVISQGKFVANLKKQACPERSRMEPKPAFGRKSEILSSKSETS